MAGRETSPADEAVDPEHEAGHGGDAEPAGDGDAQEAPAPEDWAARMAELEDDAARYLRQAQRLKADFDNYRRRMMKEQQSWKEAAVADLVQDLLPIMDNLERAVAATDDDQGEQGAASLKQGVAMTLKQFQDVLRGIGVEPVDAVGKPFDPQIHDAHTMECSREHDAGTVIAELHKGYRYKTRLLRPALVKVAQRPEDAEEGDNDE